MNTTGLKEYILYNTRVSVVHSRYGHKLSSTKTLPIHSATILSVTYNLSVLDSEIAEIDRYNTNLSNSITLLQQQRQGSSLKENERIRLRRDRIGEEIHRLESIDYASLELQLVRKLSSSIDKHIDILTTDTANHFISYCKSVLDCISKELRNDILRSTITTSNDQLDEYTDTLSTLQQQLHTVKSTLHSLLEQSSKQTISDISLLDSISAVDESELESLIASAKAQLSLHVHDSDTLVQEYEELSTFIQHTYNTVATLTTHYSTLLTSHTTRLSLLKSKLSTFVESLSTTYSTLFSRLGCVGQLLFNTPVSVSDWSIDILAQFRSNSTLVRLDSTRQSGGERAVATVAYLMALMDVAMCPFRVVDEMNQGMDPRNERLVVEQLVKMACVDMGGQMWWVTPKLLDGLEWGERVKVLCVFNGEWVELEGEGMAWRECVEREKVRVVL